ncbi:MAG: ATP-binding protein [Isosphaeraceae bacterium]
MRSLFAKILLWAVGTLALSALGFAGTTWWLSATRPPPLDLLGRLQAFQLQGARDAYEERGRDGLARYIERLDSAFDAEHHLVDPSGIDLLDGTDRSEDLDRAGVFPRPPEPSRGRALLTTGPDGPRPRMIVEIRRRFHPQEFLPYYLWILPVVAGLGYALSAHMAGPLRKLHQAVERFGRGDLSTRIGSARRDEIGELARAFDAMAGRIETLLVAERRLLQDVSHELRSPLARMALAVRLARGRDDLDPALDRIKREADRLSALVEELLQLATAEGEAPGHDAIRLDRCCRIWSATALEAEAKDCRIDLRLDGPSTVLGDANLLRRAAENVLRNAIRHAPEGSAVDVALHRADGGVTIAVRDRGTGVPGGSEEAIFRPFFRVDPDRSRASGGVGLGLAITRRALAIHGGEVVAENAHPGLLVKIRLPVAAGGSPAG